MSSTPLREQWLPVVGYEGQVDVKAIRWLRENGFGRDRLSEMFNVSRTQVGNILKNKHWL